MAHAEAGLSWSCSAGLRHPLHAGIEQETKGDAGPIVNDQDIANIVSQWTGIPIEKVQLDTATTCGVTPLTTRHYP